VVGRADPAWVQGGSSHPTAQNAMEPPQIALKIWRPLMNKGASKEEEEPPAPLPPFRGFAPGG